MTLINPAMCFLVEEDSEASLISAAGERRVDVLLCGGIKVRRALSASAINVSRKLVVRIAILC
ncbi:protein of unknown function [Legionella fallonii LLAP-10]|uniref:Uncharacterized protein n=1 Tax=Legionella fallonii LLAP-10 TaxID=1212491 RepID=A0A098FZ75_9GAMM|nr:protein of unknown function [Legionella fallonii LLAP-10]